MSEVKLCPTVKRFLVRSAGLGAVNDDFMRLIFVSSTNLHSTLLYPLLLPCSRIGPVDGEPRLLQ